MAKKAVKNPNDGELDAKEFFAAINQIEAEKGISKAYMLDKISQALIAAYKRDHDGVDDNVFVETDEEKAEVRMYVKRDVVETVDNPNTEISLEAAREVLPHVQLGDVTRQEVKAKNFGRIAAQTARQVIIQGIREAERSMVYDAFADKQQEIMNGVVTRVDNRSGALFIRLNSNGEFTEALLSAGEQVKGETAREGDRLKVYIVEVRHSTKGPQVLISRTHPGLVSRLFELEVPEIFDGTVEIKSVAREAGSRTKIAVWSDDPNVDPIGACVGKNYQRVSHIVDELRGEKVDIVKYSDDPAEYIGAALAPAKAISVTTLDEGRSSQVIVPDDQLSLAIGKEGQNARLAARLTGYKIDIKPESAAQELAALAAQEDAADDALRAQESEQDEVLADETALEEAAADETEGEV